MLMIGSVSGRLEGGAPQVRGLENNVPAKSEVATKGGSETLFPPSSKPPGVDSDAAVWFPFLLPSRRSFG